MPLVEHHCFGKPFHILWKPRQGLYFSMTCDCNDCQPVASFQSQDRASGCAGRGTSDSFSAGKNFSWNWSSKWNSFLVLASLNCTSCSHHPLTSDRAGHPVNWEYGFLMIKISSQSAWFIRRWIFSTKTAMITWTTTTTLSSWCVTCLSCHRWALVEQQQLAWEREKQTWHGNQRLDLDPKNDCKNDVKWCKNYVKIMVIKVSSSD